MTTSNSELIRQAKQGDASAIGALINRFLEPKKVSAKVALKNSCLQIMLESLDVPSESELPQLIKQWILNLNIDSITKVKIYGKQLSESLID